MSCPTCENPVISSYDYCPKCGSWLLPGPPPRYHPSTPTLAWHSGSPSPRYASSANMKDENLAFVLEVIPGLFGFLGIGHIYSGNITRGLLLLVGYWLFVSTELVLMFLVVGFCLTPANLILPLLSALWVKREMERQTLGRLSA